MAGQQQPHRTAVFAFRQMFVFARRCFDCQCVLRVVPHVVRIVFWTMVVRRPPFMVRGMVLKQITVPIQIQTFKGRTQGIVIDPKDAVVALHGTQLVVPQCFSHRIGPTGGVFR